jgi:hypothetical protein
MAEITQLVKKALEDYATFKDSDVEAGIHNLLYHLDNDLDIAVYSPTKEAEQALEKLEETMDSIAEDVAAEEIEAVEAELDEVEDEDEGEYDEDEDDEDDYDDEEDEDLDLLEEEDDGA